MIMCQFMNPFFVDNFLAYKITAFKLVILMARYSDQYPT